MRWNRGDIAIAAVCLVAGFGVTTYLGIFSIKPAPQIGSQVPNPNHTINLAPPLLPVIQHSSVVSKRSKTNQNSKSDNGNGSGSTVLAAGARTVTYIAYVTPMSSSTSASSPVSSTPSPPKTPTPTPTPPLPSPSPSVLPSPTTSPIIIAKVKGCVNVIASVCVSVSASVN